MVQPHEEKKLYHKRAAYSTKNVLNNMNLFFEELIINKHKIFLNIKYKINTHTAKLKLGYP